jgi:hypothetical protein
MMNDDIDTSQSLGATSTSTFAYGCLLHGKTLELLPSPQHDHSETMAVVPLTSTVPQCLLCEYQL